MELNKILKIASSTAKIELEDIEIKNNIKDYLFGKKYLLEINLDLNNLEKIMDLEIYMDFINQGKVKLLNKNDHISLDKNSKIKWKVLPGELNHISFTIWQWNKIFLGSLLVILVTLFSYFLRNNRYELGSDLPELPSE